MLAATSVHPHDRTCLSNSAQQWNKEWCVCGCAKVAIDSNGRFLAYFSDANYSWVISLKCTKLHFSIYDNRKGEKNFNEVVLIIILLEGTSAFLK